MSILTITRSGRFHARTIINTTRKCGAMSNRSYSYFVRICASDRKLSPEGFIINNEHIQEFFDSRFGKRAKPWRARSCELLAIQSAREIASLVHKNGVECMHIEVTITGSNGAKISALWTQGEPMGKENLFGCES